MSCPSCALVNQVEFSAEMIIHFMGPKKMDSPGVWVFPKLLICSDCGFARFTVPEAELELLAVGTPKTERLKGESGVDDSLLPSRDCAATGNR